VLNIQLSTTLHVPDKMSVCDKLGEQLSPFCFDKLGLNISIVHRNIYAGILDSGAGKSLIST